MGATTQVLDSHAPQHQASSPPTSTIEPGPLPALKQPAHDTSSHSDQSFASSCSSSSSILPDVTAVTGILSIQMESRHAQEHTQKLQKTLHNQPDQKDSEKHKELQPQSYPNKDRSTKGECCKCAIGLTADCAAVCCCPLALLHLLALTFIKLPSAMAWRVFTKTKKRLCHKKRPANDTDNEGKGPSQSPQVSLAAATAAAAQVEHVVRLDSENLWQHFEAGDVGFGGFSLKTDG